MAKQKKQDRSRAQKPDAERGAEQGRKGAAEGRERTGSPADMARKGKKPSFGHN